MKHKLIAGQAMGAALAALFLAGCGSLIPSPTPTATSTPTFTPTITPTSTSTATPSPTLTATPAPTNTPAATSTPSPYDGDWAGRTSEGLDITFSVSQQVISGMSVSCQAGLGLSGASATLTFNPPELNGPIVDGKFSFKSLAMTLTGTFHSPRSASGTLTSEPGLSLCQLNTISWNASKK